MFHFLGWQPSLAPSLIFRELLFKQSLVIKSGKQRKLDLNLYDFYILNCYFSATFSSKIIEVAKICDAGDFLLIFLHPLIFIIKMHLLHIIPHVCAENLSPMSPIFLVILIKLICYENTAIALVKK